MFANNGINANFAALANITGTDTWVADKNTDCTGILYGNTIITSPINLPGGVYNITSAFASCESLAVAPELPEGITTMSSAFARCFSLVRLPELPSTLKNMSNAFQACKIATTAPSIIPERVENISTAFKNCWILNDTIEINATNLTNYSGCFENTSRDGGSVTITGSCPILAELAATNAQGKVVVNIT
jgi:hypothetical protein